MTALTVETAFDAYESVRDRLPRAGTTDRAPVWADCLDDIADAYDAVLLDAFGVLNIGETAIPGVAARIAGLRARGKQVLVVSNAASASHAALVGKYARMGYDFAPGQIVTSRMALLSSMDGHRGLHWGLMASRDAGLRDFESLHLTYLEDDPGPYDAVAGFLLVGSAGWTETRQALLEQALLRAPRPVLVGNPDIVAPREAGFSSEPGLFAHRLADRTGIAPAFFGKPFAGIFDLALARLDPLPPKSRILMVGDSLHTDILGAQAAGIASALVAGYGFFDGGDVDAAIARAGIVPDYVLNRP